MNPTSPAASCAPRSSLPLATTPTTNPGAQAHIETGRDPLQCTPAHFGESALGHRSGWRWGRWEPLPKTRRNSEVLPAGHARHVD